MRHDETSVLHYDTQLTNDTPAPVPDGGDTWHGAPRIEVNRSPVAAANVSREFRAPSDSTHTHHRRHPTTRVSRLLRRTYCTSPPVLAAAATCRE